MRSRAVQYGDVMTDADLLAIEARANAATAGPWTPRVDSKEGWSTDSNGHSHRHCTYLYPNGKLHIFQGQEFCRPAIHMPQACADADFIAHARIDVPALLAEVRRLNAENFDLHFKLNALSPDSMYAKVARKEEREQVTACAQLDAYDQNGVRR